jgi:hypothetical protein
MPIKWVVMEVIGIADCGSNEKIVEITWKYDFSSLPKEVENAIRPLPSTVNMLFRLYGGVWRCIAICRIAASSGSE